MLPTPYFRDEFTTIYCGNCRDIVPQLGFVDVVLSDPPYDARTHAGARTNTVESRERERVNDADPLPAVGTIAIGFNALSSVIWPARLRFVSKRWCVIFCSLEQLGAYQEAAGDDYIRGGFYRRHGAPQFSGDRPAQGGEGLAILHREGAKHWNGGGTAAYWESPRVADHERVHPTQKPLDLMLQLVHLFSDPGETVLDPFMGSGTTLVACQRLGRKSIGIELNEDYCKDAVERLAQPSLRFTDIHAEPTQGSIDI